MDRLKILNIWVDSVDRKAAIDRVESFFGEDRPHSIFAVNPEKNFTVVKDPFLFETIKDADLLIPDGIGIVMAAKVLYGATLRRVPGVEFMNDICQLAERKRKPIFIYGASETVNKAATDKLRRRYPDLVVAGRSNGYIPESGMPELIRRINHCGAEVLFLALGSPRQEKWFSRYARELKFVKVCQGIGGSLDTIAGKVKRAPKIWQKFSAEWLYRLVSEPRRIERQKVLPIFALNVLRVKLRLHHDATGLTPNFPGIDRRG